MLSLPKMLNRIHELGKAHDIEGLTGVHKTIGVANYRLFRVTKRVKPLSKRLNQLLMHQLNKLAVDLAHLGVGPLPEDVQTALNYYKEHGVR